MQPLAAGVMVNVTVIGALVVFIKVPDMLPLPEAAIPVTLAVLFLVQLKIVPVTAPVIIIGVMVLCEQTFCVNGVAKIVGVGLTKTVVVISGPAHPFKVE